METVQLTYIGRVLTNKNKIGYEYIDNYGKHCLFSKKLSSVPIGSIIECNREGETYKSPYKLVGQHNNSDDIRRWLNRDIVSYDELQLLTQVTKTVSRKHQEAVEILRKGYKECSYSQRQLYINRLIVEITK